MQKIVKIGEKELKLVSSGATPIFYSNAFHRDFFKDLSEFLKFAEMANGNGNNEEEGNLKEALEIFGSGAMLLFYNFAWIYAYNADHTIKPLDEWLESFDVFPIADILGDIIDLIMSSVTVKKESRTSTQRKKRST